MENLDILALAPSWNDQKTRARVSGRNLAPMTGRASQDTIPQTIQVVREWPSTVKRARKVSDQSVLVLSQVKEPCYTTTTLLL